MNQEFQLIRYLRARLNPKKTRDYLLNHKPTQIYIRIDMSAMAVSVEGMFNNSLSLVIMFYTCPTLAQAVIRAREFCRRYYHDVSVLEYNVQ